MHREYGGRRRYQDDRREIPRYVKRRYVKVGVDGPGADRCDYDRITIGRRFGDEFHADVAVGAGAVIDDELTAKALRQFVAQHARRNVARATGSMPMSRSMTEIPGANGTTNRTGFVGYCWANAVLAVAAATKHNVYSAVFFI